MEPILVSVQVACDLLGVRKTKLYALLKGQQLERKKIGGKTLITFQSIRDLANLNSDNRA